MDREPLRQSQSEHREAANGTSPQTAAPTPDPSTPTTPTPPRLTPNPMLLDSPAPTLTPTTSSPPPPLTPAPSVAASHGPKAAGAPSPHILVPAPPKLTSTAPPTLRTYSRPILPSPSGASKTSPTRHTSSSSSSSPSSSVAPATVSPLLSSSATHSNTTKTSTSLTNGNTRPVTTPTSTPITPFHTPASPPGRQVSQAHPAGTPGLVRANQSPSPVRQRVSQQTLLLGKGLKGSGQDQVLLRAQMLILTSAMRPAQPSSSSSSSSSPLSSNPASAQLQSLTLRPPPPGALTIPPSLRVKPPTSAPPPLSRPHGPLFPPLRPRPQPSTTATESPTTPSRHLSVPPPTLYSPVRAVPLRPRLHSPNGHRAPPPRQNLQPIAAAPSSQASPISRPLAGVKNCPLAPTMLGSNQSQPGPSPVPNPLSATSPFERSPSAARQLQIIALSSGRQTPSSPFTHAPPPVESHEFSSQSKRTLTGDDVLPQNPKLPKTASPLPSPSSRLSPASPSQASAPTQTLIHKGETKESEEQRERSRPIRPGVRDEPSAAEDLRVEKDDQRVKVKEEEKQTEQEKGKEEEVEMEVTEEGEQRKMEEEETPMDQSEDQTPRVLHQFQSTDPVAAPDPVKDSVVESKPILSVFSVPVQKPGPLQDQTPVRVPTQTPVQVQTPVPVQIPKPVPVQTPTPLPVQTPKPVPVQTPKPLPVQTPKPVPVQIPKPLPVQTPKPLPVQTPKPVPVQTPKPLPVQTPTPVPVQSPVPLSPPVPVPVPEPVPVQTQTPVPVQTPKPEPVQTPITASAPVPIQTPTPVPVQTPVPVSGPVPVPVPEPVPEPVQTPTPVPVQTPVPLSVPKPVPVQTPTPVPEASVQTHKPPEPHQDLQPVSQEDFCENMSTQSDNQSALSSLSSQSPPSSPFITPSAENPPPLLPPPTAHPTDLSLPQHDDKADKAVSETQHLDETETEPLGQSDDESESFSQSLSSPWEPKAWPEGRQVLTHLVEGFVIQEGLQPFPVNRSSLLVPEQVSQPQEVNGTNGRAALPVTDTIKQPEHSTDSDEEEGGDTDDPGTRSGHRDRTVLHCQFCGKRGHAHNFMRSKRFCSTSCARGFNVRLTKRLRALSAGSRSERPRPALNRAESVPGKPLLLRLPRDLWSAGRREKEGKEKVVAAEEEEEEEEEEEDRGGGREEEEDDDGGEEMDPAVAMTARMERQTAQRARRASAPAVTTSTPTTTFKPAPSQWSVEEVTAFIHTLPGCGDVAEAFRVQEIDGQALLLLTEDHLMTSMNIKLGPALKICAHINALKNQ